MKEFTITLTINNCPEELDEDVMKSYMENLQMHFQEPLEIEDICVDIDDESDYEDALEDDWEDD